MTAATSGTSRTRSAGRSVGLVAAGLLAGGVLAGAGSALAAGTATTSPGSSTGTGPGSSTQGTAPQGRPADGQGRPGHGGAAAVRSDEKVLTGTDAEKAKAAALKAVPGGTVYRVETDAGDGVYEAHATKADGTEVTVKLDKSFAVTAVEDGMGKGDPAPSGTPSA